MTVQTDSRGQMKTRTAATPPAPDAPNASTALLHELKRMAPQIAMALPKHITPERMGRICMTAVSTTPKLAECTRDSFFGAILSCAQLGLEPNTNLGHAYLIPFYDSRKRVTICQLIIGYQGMVELAHRSGRVSSVVAHVVRDGDRFEYELGLRPKLVHVPSDFEDRESRKITHVYAVAQIRDGDPISWVLSRPQIEARRVRGASGRKYADGNQVRTPWDTDYEAMAMKTAVRALFRWLPKSPEIVAAERFDSVADAGRLEIEIPEVASALTSGGISTTKFDEETGEVLDGTPRDAAGSAPVSEEEQMRRDAADVDAGRA